mmetsp:Transcript_853/g.1479  ORF Transcript_853/g.1479 Transcript_853/m.1479 type:complete len:109 (+) Transcript_853:828-1154(+)
MPVEARRKVVRKLAYLAGVVRLSGEVYDLVSAELLNLLDVLIVDAFEASKDIDYAGVTSCQARKAQYGNPGSGIDMYNIPPSTNPNPCGRRRIRLHHYTRHYQASDRQ